VGEIEVNVAYRWFLGLKLTDPVFDASTLSQNRWQFYNDTSVAQDIFDAIVEHAGPWRRRTAIAGNAEDAALLQPLSDARGGIAGTEPHGSDIKSRSGAGWRSSRPRNRAHWPALQRCR
jgi:hypothetical protein